MDEDYETGQKLKEEVIPLALEFYMDVIDQEDEDEDEDEEAGQDSEEEKPKKKAK